MPNCIQDLLKRFLGWLNCAHRYNPNWVCELIAEIPRVKFLVVMIVADRGCSVEGVREGRVDLCEFASVQIEAEANLGFCVGRWVDCVKNAASWKKMNFSFQEHL